MGEDFVLDSAIKLAAPRDLLTQDDNAIDRVKSNG
jgi:hypothetical protein